MRSLATLAFFFTISLEAQRTPSRPEPARQDQILENVRQYAMGHLDRAENISCSEAPFAGSAKTITVDFSGVSHGTASSIDTASMIRDVFSPSSGAEIYRDHAGTLRGGTVGVYNYSFVSNGKTHAGSIYANEETGAIARITFRGADAAAHLFCSALK